MKPSRPWSRCGARRTAGPLVHVCMAGTVLALTGMGEHVSAMLYSHHLITLPMVCSDSTLNNYLTSPGGVPPASC